MTANKKGLFQSLRNRFLQKNQCDDVPVEESGTAVIPRQAHCISRSDISDNALKVLYRLKSAEYAAFLVGGGVRDLLLARQPKDFDVVTDATPEQIRKLFRNSRIIGRRFRLVHVYFSDEVIEVSTFRGQGDEGVVSRKGRAAGAKMIRTDNTFGTIEEDAWRRDFTINALFYDINDFSVVDFTRGMADLKSRQLRMIGDPEARFHEDPVRLLRAIRLASKLGFEIEKNTVSQLRRLPQLLKNVPEARLLDEVIKIFFEGNALVSYRMLEKVDYFSVLFPTVAVVIKADKSGVSTKLVEYALEGTDIRFHSQQRLTPGFLFAALLWPVLVDTLKKLRSQGQRISMALHVAMHDVIKGQSTVFVITRRMVAMIHAMWALQFHLERRRPRRILHIMSQRYFRAAFDLLILRAKAGEVDMKLVEWWQQIQELPLKKRRNMIHDLRKRIPGV